MRARFSFLVAFGLGILVAHVLGPPGATGSGGPPSFADVIARSDPSVAHVSTVLEGERAPRSRDDAVGAGFVYSPDGLIVTSRHTLQGAKRILVTLADRGALEARIVGQDEVTDVALLRVSATGLVPLPSGDPRRLRKGDWVLAAGSPFHLPRSWSAGIVSGLGRTGVGVTLKGFEDFIQTDAAANIGNSGGPLLDTEGRVVGMMTAILSRTGRSQGVSLAVPIDVVLDSAKRLSTGGRVARPSLGVVVRETDLRGAGGGGLQVTRFQPGAPAIRAGLRPGDVIVSVDGVATPRVVDMQRAIWRHRPGETVVVIFLRGARRLQAPVRLTGGG